MHASWEYRICGWFKHPQTCLHTSLCWWHERHLALQSLRCVRGAWPCMTATALCMNSCELLWTKASAKCSKMYWYLITCIVFIIIMILWCWTCNCFFYMNLVCHCTGSRHFILKYKNIKTKVAKLGKNNKKYCLHEWTWGGAGKQF